MWIGDTLIPMGFAIFVGCALLVIVVGCILGFLAWISSRTNNEPDSMYNQPSGREDSEPESSDNEEKATVMVGQRFPYFEGSDSPIFVVTDVDEDENEVRGFVIFPLPTGAKNIDIEVNPDDDTCFTVKYSMPDGTFVRDPWDLSDAPDGLEDYNTYAEKQVADPADIEIK